MSVRRGFLPTVLIAPLLIGLSGLACTTAQQRATPAASDTLVKVAILSRHGVRSPIPKQPELDTWTASQWPIWRCPTNDDPNRGCDLGQLTPQGQTLAEQMGTYYRTYLSGLLPTDRCPAQDDVFFWADLTERTEKTGLALLRGFRPSCDIAKYFHTASPPPLDRIFHPVTTAGRCTLDADRAEAEIYFRAGGNFPAFITTRNLENELSIAQKTLQCCQSGLCQDTWDKCRLPPPPPTTCTLADLPSCVVRTQEAGTPTRVELGGALRVASTFAELLLLEYANGFPPSDVGWERITRLELSQVFRLHTAVFDLEQRTDYIAKRQGSMLLKKIQLALQDKTDNTPGTAPPGAKFVAYVGHDTNISNVAAMLGLSWQQPGYQKDQTPPAGALIFELHRFGGTGLVSAFYLAQSLDDMRAVKGDPVKTNVPIPGCGGVCTLADFTKLVEQALDPDCSQ